MTRIYDPQRKADDPSAVEFGINAVNQESIEMLTGGMKKKKLN